MRLIGGLKWYFRVLNEVISDIDELLDKEAYKTSIEKIKTISATFMGASGLQIDDGTGGDREIHPNAHLETMIDFCIEIQKVVEEFSRNMLWFR